MKIQFGQQQERQETAPQQGKTVIAANLTRKSVVLDAQGNEIDLRTKRIIKRAGEQE